METNETKIFFDAALEMALRAEIDHELAQTPSPAELKRKYPDTSRWDARLYAALSCRRKPAILLVASSR